MKNNTALITGLFMLMILAFTVDPIFIYHFQNNLLGKAIVILVLIYLTMNNVTLGLLFTLAIILISSKIDMPMIEGLRNKKNKKNARSVKKTIKKVETKCKTLEELLREERLKRLAKKKSIKNQVNTMDEVNNNDTNDNNNNTNNKNNKNAGVDRITIEDTFRVRNPSTIPVTKEAFRVRELNPADNTSKYYGSSCSLI